MIRAMQQAAPERIPWWLPQHCEGTPHACAPGLPAELASIGFAKHALHNEVLQLLQMKV